MALWLVLFAVLLDCAKLVSFGGFCTKNFHLFQERPKMDKSVGLGPWRRGPIVTRRLYGCLGLSGNRGIWAAPSDGRAIWIWAGREKVFKTPQIFRFYRPKFAIAMIRANGFFQ